ncbi:T9SS type A sorting domain-containing protein, partial [Microcystis aeruginosa]|uniref:T9SS type A sorting domain-containing protein n=1 Tax=Microcystis aeruginosa TaxID=1126 RepID=UPI0011150A59
ATSNVVLVYQLIGSVWTQIGEALLGENTGDRFGYSIGLTKDGSKLAVGARWNSIAGFRRGRAYVFENQGGNWTQINNAMLGVADNDNFGFSIAISQDGSRVVVGAINNDTTGNNAGQVQVFENTLLSTTDFESNSVSFYPNPAKDRIIFSSKNTIENITLYNLVGQKVLYQEVYNTEIELDISHLSVG